MRERILKTLKAYLETNRDVLTNNEVKDIKEQIEIVKRYKGSFIKRFNKHRNNN